MQMTAHWEFARRHLNNLQTIRSKILWFVWRKPSNEHHLINTIPTVKHRAVGMCFFCNRDFETSLNQRKDVEKHRAILSNCVCGAEILWQAQKFTFQQDNNPQYVAKNTQQWLQKNSAKNFYWPSQFRDLNPTQLLWRQAVHVTSFPRRANVVVTAKGLLRVWMLKLNALIFLFYTNIQWIQKPVFVFAFKIYYDEHLTAQDQGEIKKRFSECTEAQGVLGWKGHAEVIISLKISII